MQAEVYRRTRWRWAEFRVGESIFVPFPEAIAAAVGALSYGERNGKRFQTRKRWERLNAAGEWELCDEADEGATLGKRIWRTGYE